MKESNTQTGFTLLELMVVLAIVAILAAIAAPSFQNMREQRLVESRFTTLLRDVQFAKSEAIARGKTVTVCQSNGGTACNGGNARWNRGWIVFIDDGAGGGTPTDGIRNGDEKIVRAQALQDRDDVRIWVRRADRGNSGGGNGTGRRSNIIFDSLGRPNLINGGNFFNARMIFNVCSEDSNGSTGTDVRAIMVELSGQIFRSQDSDDDGLHEERFLNNQGVLQTRAVRCT